MRGAVAERRRADFDIPAPTAGMFTHTRSGRGRICHFLRTMMVWSTRFRSGRGKLGVGPISCGADFAPAPPPLRDRACVNTCNDLCWSQFSARLRPRMCERTLRTQDCDFPFVHALMHYNNTNPPESVLIPKPMLFTKHSSRPQGTLATITSPLQCIMYNTKSLNRYSILLQQQIYNCHEMLSKERPFLPNMLSYVMYICDYICELISPYLSLNKCWNKNC